jgi:Tfp pilus assembly protein FimT
MKTLWRREEGWSMVELILTLTLFGLLIALALPTFTRFGEYVEKEMFLKLLASDLAYAQTQAISTEADIIVSFDTKAGWVLVSRDRIMLRRLKIPYHFRLQTNFARDQLIFRHTGQSVGGTIQLKSGERMIGKIAIQVASGVPRVELIPQ